MSAPTGIGLGEDLRVKAAHAGGTAEAWLWWTHVPPLAGERIGAIGHFSATSAAAAARVLDEATAKLGAQGCTLAVGPMDGNTWRGYRFVTDAGTAPPFFLEPANPLEWPAWWREAGFESRADYFSTATDDLAARDARLDGVASRMRVAGVTTRAFDPTRFEEELSGIHEVSVVSFQENFLYTPVSREQFVDQYRPMREHLSPELVRIAEQAGRPVGYVFATPDFAAAERGAPVTSAIVKTLAVLPGRTWAGLGALLLGEVHDAMRRQGFTRAIHALMHETNKSRNLSAHYAKTIRRYTLFARRVAEREPDKIVANAG